MVKTLHFTPYSLPEPTRFVSLSEQERAEAVFSVCNNAAKALMLWMMKRGKEYTKEELAAKMRSFLGRKVPLELAENLRAYCRLSLEPAGLVTERQDFRKLQFGKVTGKRLVTLYAITIDGQSYAKPAIARFLLLADELDISLNNLNGATKRNGRTSSAYTIARILEVLAERDGPHTPHSIREKLGLAKECVVLQNIMKLASLGLVSYKGTGIDTSKQRKAELADKDKLDRYLENGAELKSAILSCCPKFKNFDRLRGAMELRLQEIDRGILSGAFAAANKKLRGNEASEVVSILCRIGAYRFKGGARAIRSRAEVTEVRITEDGEFAYYSAYRPVLSVAGNPKSPYADEGYQKVLAHIKPGIRTLFRGEFSRFLQTNGRINRSDTGRNCKAVLKAARRQELEEFRTRELMALLRLPMHAVNKSVRALRKSGFVEKGSTCGCWKLVRKEPEAVMEKALSV